MGNKTFMSTMVVSGGAEKASSRLGRCRIRKPPVTRSSWFRHSHITIIVIICIPELSQHEGTHHLLIHHIGKVVFFNLRPHSTSFIHSHSLNTHIPYWEGPFEANYPPFTHPVPLPVPFPARTDITMHWQIATVATAMKIVMQAVATATLHCNVAT